MVPEKARSRREILKILSHKLDGEQMLGDDYSGEPRWTDEEMERCYLPRGKAADLIVIKGDPSQKIEDIENAEIVFKDGVGYDPIKLIESVRGTAGSR